MNILALTNQKGGCGKTTSAVNLSFALAQKGKKVLIIDLDPQAHATMGLGLKKVSVENSTYALFMGNEKVPDVARLTTFIDERVDIIASHIILSTVEHELKERDNGILIMFRALMYTDLEYDYVLIDCPPNLGFLTFNAIRAANQVIVPVETSTFAIMGVSKLISMIELIKLKLHHSPLVKGLVTMYDPTTEFSHKMLTKIKNIFKSQVFNSIISYDIAIKEAQEKLVSIFQYNKDCEGARDYLQLSDEIVNMENDLLPESLYRELQKILYTSVYSREKIFNLFAPEAKEVYVVGNFNNWQITDEANLLRSGSGVWERKVYLEPGHYRYKFIVDGLYFPDPENPQKEQDPYGNHDSVFDI